MPHYLSKKEVLRVLGISSLGTRGTHEKTSMPI